MRILRSILLACTFASLGIVGAAQSEEFPTRAAQELANLHEGMTLAVWMRAHPRDAAVLYSHRHWDWGNWIVRADNRERLANGREIIRRAYFYAPDPPADMALPRSVSGQKIRDGAQLGFIWLETNEPETVAGPELAERTREGLSTRFGKGQYDPKLWFANAAYWNKTAKWNAGPATFVSAYESIASGSRPSRVLAFGFLPVSGLHVDLGGGEDIYGEAFDAELRSLDAAFAASGLVGKDLAASFSRASVFSHDRGIGNCAPGFTCLSPKLIRISWLWPMAPVKDTSTPPGIREPHRGRGQWPSHIIFAYCDRLTPPSTNCRDGKKCGACWPGRHRQAPTFSACTTDARPG